MKKYIVILLVLFAVPSIAQNVRVLDEIVAVVGENIITRSELEAEYAQAKESMNYFEGDLKCEILNQLIVQKLYLHKGDLDSTYADDARVDAEVDRRIQYYAGQIGGEANLEKYLGKTIAEYKAQMRDKIAQQMVSQQVQQMLIADVKASPTDVRKYFATIPKDSLPKFGKEVEIGMVAMKPEPSAYARKYALEDITKLRQSIIDGKYTFDMAARLNSDDKTTAVNGGELGYFSRGQMVSSFERAAFRLPEDSISEVIETKYGYHILQLIDRKGEKVNVRHILLKPLIVNSDFERLKGEMDSLITALKEGKMTMCAVASKNSVDVETKDNCGYFTDRNTGANLVPVDGLDPIIAAMAERMKVGEYSIPEKYQDYDGTLGYRFFVLSRIVPAHTANLKEDYQKIQNLALEKKQEDTVNEWVEEYKQSVYVWIDEKYVGCKELSTWKGLSN